MSPTLISVNITIYVSHLFQRLYRKLTPKISERPGPKYWAITERKTTKSIIPIIITPPIVGVPFFPACKPANSVAAPISHSDRIFFPNPSFIKSLIPQGIINIVSIAVIKRLESIKTRLDILREVEVQKIPPIIVGFLFLQI